MSQRRLVGHKEQAGGGGTGGRLQPVLMRHTPQLSVKTRGGGVGGGPAGGWGGGVPAGGRGGGSGRESGGGGAGGCRIQGPGPAAPPPPPQGVGGPA